MHGVFAQKDGVEFNTLRNRLDKYPLKKIHSNLLQHYVNLLHIIEIYIEP